MSNNPILILAGTNRRGSNSLRIARQLLAHYSELGVPARLLDLSELPVSIAHPDAYENKPAQLQPFLDAVLAARGLHLVIGEYNGGPPGILKLFIDHWSYPEAFEGKAVAFVGVAAGEWGALRAVEQMQGIFGYRNATQLPRRVFIKQVGQKLDANGAIADPELADRLRRQVAEFTEFCHGARVGGAVERAYVIEAGGGGDLRGGAR